MQKLRRLNFFERKICLPKVDALNSWNEDVGTSWNGSLASFPHPIERANTAGDGMRNSGISPGVAGNLAGTKAGSSKVEIINLSEIEISCVCGCNHGIWIGSATGEIYLIPENFVLKKFRAFTEAVFFLIFNQKLNSLFSIGKDEDASGGMKYKFFACQAALEGDILPLIREAKLFSSRIPEEAVLCCDVAPNAGMLALGTKKAGVCLFRGDLINERTCRLRTFKQDDHEVTSLHFTSFRDSYALFVCSYGSITSYYIQDKGELQLLFHDNTGGCSPHCAIVSHAQNSLLVLSNEAVFTYDPEQGNLSAIPCDGEGLSIRAYKSYFVAISQDMPPTLPDLAGSPKELLDAVGHTAERQTIFVCLSCPDIRFVAFSCHITKFIDVVPAMGSLFILADGEKRSERILFELKEHTIHTRLDILMRKKLFDWAVVVATLERQTDDYIQSIYRLYGDWLYEKNRTEQATEMYLKTVGHTEPSYIIEKYLNNDSILSLTSYLLELHRKGLAGKDHTLLFFKCCTISEDYSKLREFLEIAHELQYDLEGMIHECRISGLHTLAIEMANQQNLHLTHISILIEDLRDYEKAIACLSLMDKPVACSILLRHGQVLLKHEPTKTLSLMKEIMSICFVSPDVFLPMFIGSDDLLRNFLFQFMDSSTDQRTSRKLSSGIFLVYLEQLLREYKTHVTTFRQSVLSIKDERAAHSIQSPQNEVIENDAVSKGVALSQQILKLLREHCFGEHDVQAVLNLCHVYEYEPGIIYCSEKSESYQIPFSLYVRNSNADAMLNYCVRYGAKDPNLWTQALTFFASLPGSERYILEVLKHIGQNMLLPPLAVLGILKHGKDVKIGSVKEYLLNSFKQLSSTRNASNERIIRDYKEIMRMRHEISVKNKRATVFNRSHCCQCDAPLELPSVHFYCGHVYHFYCITSESKCPKCSPNVLAKKMLREQREIRGNVADDFFKFLRGSRDGLDFIATCYSKGMFPVTCKPQLLERADVHRS